MEVHGVCCVVVACGLMYRWDSFGNEDNQIQP